MPVRLSLVLALALQLAQPVSAQDAVASLRAEIDRRIAARAWTELVEPISRLRALATASGDRVLEAEALRRLGLVHRELKAYAEAQRAFEEALGILQAAGQRSGAGQLHEDLGLMAWMTGDAAGTRVHYSAAADEYAAAGQRALQASALRNITFSSDLTIEERVAMLERAWVIADGSGDRHLQGLIRHQLGDMFNMRGDYDRGFAALEHAVSLLDGYAREQALALTSLGRSYRLHGLTDRALAAYERVLKIAEQIDDRRAIAQTHDAIGTALSQGGRVRESVAPYERAVTIARREQLHNVLPFFIENYAVTLVKLEQYEAALAALESEGATMPSDVPGLNAPLTRARAYLGLGRLSEAAAAAEFGVTRHETGTRSIEFLVDALYARAAVRREQRQRDAAIQDVTRALDLLESLRVKAAPHDAMKRSFVDRHRELFSLAISLYTDAGEAGAAFEITERARARAFQDLLAARALLPLELRTDTRQLPSSIATPPARLADIRRTLSAMASTLLAYWVTSNTITIWVVPPAGEVTTRTVPASRSRIEQLTRQAWQTGSDPGPALRELYRGLVAPVADRLPKDAGSLISVVPHGVLFNVPFAALLDGNSKYFVERYRLHYVASAALLQAPAPPKDGTVLLVADPSPMPQIESGRLAALPGARAEVGDIAQLLPPQKTIRFTGAMATASRVRAAGADARAIHLATHGLVYDDRPFDSFLALAPETGASGRLTTSDIYDWRVGAELVVLSGCRTATGETTGDGVHGLARAFFYAGTPSIVATLWDLPDRPARHLFPRFYTAWLAGASKSAALRQAQIDLIRALRAERITVDTPLGKVTLAEHPAIWAAPVLLGQP